LPVDAGVLITHARKSDAPPRLEACVERLWKSSVAPVPEEIRGVVTVALVLVIRDRVEPLDEVHVPGRAGVVEEVLKVTEVAGVVEAGDGIVAAAERSASWRGRQPFVEGRDHRGIR